MNIIMEKWEMTFKQYLEYAFENNKYKKVYEQKLELWDIKRKQHFRDWENILLERAEIGVIPSDVIMSYIRETSESVMFRMFKGTRAKGISDFRIPKKIRELRV